MKMKILIASLILLFACTTIDTESYTYSKNEPFNGINRESPPASKNPKCDWYRRDFHYQKTNIGFALYMVKRIKKYPELGKLVIGIYVDIAPNDGLNWRRGDLMGMAVYYEEANGD